MAYPFFSHNTELLPIDQAVVSLQSVEYSYGFGVYETIRAVHGRAIFLDEHAQRLMQSAKIINLEHNFSEEIVKRSVQALLEKNKVSSCNIKILLIGGPSPDTATLEIMCLNPLFVDRKLYKSGVSCITYNYEREFPLAKTLNMLPSFLAYRQATRAGAYDALFINRRECISEGTRTNFFALSGRTLISPKSNEILPGVTRAKLLGVARDNKFEITEQDIRLSEVDRFDNLFLTSTSSKVLPICSIDQQNFTPLSPALEELIQAFDRFLDSVVGSD